MKRALYIIPVLLFAALAYVLFDSLRSPPPDELPSVLVGKSVPGFGLQPLDAQAQGFAPKDLASGHVTVVNVWASWCVPCREEAPMLAALTRDHDVVLYGLVYKDTPARARAFLNQVGNPFARLDLDADGRAGIGWGVYDVPETFVIDGSGIVRARHSGPLTQEVMLDEVLPAIAAARPPG